MRLRGEMEWPSPEALKAQIFKDVARAKRYFPREKQFATFQILAFSRVRSRAAFNDMRARCYSLRNA